MLLKDGYRHVYISRKFAKRHGFIPKDTLPGHYGYSGLVNLGTWPITLTSTSKSSDAASTIIRPQSSPLNLRALKGSLPPVPSSRANPTLIQTVTSPTIPTPAGPTTASHLAGPHASSPLTVNMTVYLSEEPHFDVVLGRSFFERRQIRTSTSDPTEVYCLDTGEKIECELVILKDGKGDIVTVT
jgi:hypothetical protein